MSPTFTLSDRLRRRVLISAVLASSMAFIDSTALNVALPALQDDLGASGADLLWIVNAYLLLLGALLLLGGSLGDHLGRKRIFGVGIVLFAGGSLVCGLAPDTAILIGAR
ncbi:MAG TPA: MFS transporter, partial [Aggregatilineaceae bacterium]|nr:MFS transporter [Aggregatilineaceae bacterium]